MEQRRENIWWALGWSMVVVYSILFLILDQLPLLDLANHATRAYVINELLRGRGPTELFSFSFIFQPYILGDLIFSAVYALLPFRLGALVYLAVLVLFWMYSVMAYARQRGLKPEQLLCLFLILPWLASNYFLLSGFMNWILGSALGFLCLMMVDASREAEHLSKLILRMVCFSALAFLCYLIHLAPVIILCAVVPAIALQWKVEGDKQWTRALVFLLPLLILVSLHLALGNLGGSSHEVWSYASLSDKIKRLVSPLARYDFTVDGVLCLLFLLPVMVSLSSSESEMKRRWPIFLPLSAALALYFVLPYGMGPATDVDTRSLLYVMVFSVVGLLQLVRESVLSRSALLGCYLACSVINFAYLASYLLPANRHLRDYVSLMKEIPRGESVLPLSTREVAGRLHFSWHPPETAIVELGLVVPCLFSSNVVGDQLRYFSYVHNIYCPSPMEFIHGKVIDWQKVRSIYDYVLVEKPYASASIDPSLQLVKENASGALYSEIRSGQEFAEKRAQ